MNRNYEFVNLKRKEKHLSPYSPHPKGDYRVRAKPPVKTYRDYLKSSDYSQRLKDFYLKQNYDRM